MSAPEVVLALREMDRYDLADAVVELIASHTESIKEIERLRDAMFRVYSVAANGGNVTPWIERMRDTMDQPWSVDRSRAALAKATGDSHDRP